MASQIEKNSWYLHIFGFSWKRSNTAVGWVLQNQKSIGSNNPKNDIEKFMLSVKKKRNCDDFLKIMIYLIGQIKKKFLQICLFKVIKSYWFRGPIRYFKENLKYPLKISDTVLLLLFLFFVWIKEPFSVTTFCWKDGNASF